MLEGDLRLDLTELRRVLIEPRLILNDRQLILKDEREIGYIFEDLHDALELRSLNVKLVSELSRLLVIEDLLACIHFL